MPHQPHRRLSTRSHHNGQLARHHLQSQEDQRPGLDQVLVLSSLTNSSRRLITFANRHREPDVET